MPENPIEILRRQDLRQYVRTRPGGTNKRTGQQLPPIAYVPWRSMVHLLDQVLPGQWHTKVRWDELGVAVALTIVTPDGPVTREALAQVGNPGNAPPLEVAERAAFIRAVGMFGLSLPSDYRVEGDGQANRQAPPQQQQAPPAGEPRRCRCGSPLRGDYTTCLACHTYPDRTPGVCVSPGCGKLIKTEFAKCYRCVQEERTGGADAGQQQGPPPAQAGGNDLPF